MQHYPVLQNIENDINTVCIAAESFPDGVHDAHEKLHALLTQKANRIFYGISHANDQGVTVYYAAASEIFEGEAASLNCKSFLIKKGIYSGVLLKDYYKDIPSVGRTFNDLLKDPRLDPKGFCLEIYRDGKDSRDLMCLVKLSDAF